jgi:predicted membrane protein
MPTDHRAQLIVECVLLLQEHAHAARQVFAQQPMQAVTVETDQLAQDFVGQQRTDVVAFLFGDDLQQHGAGDDLAGF